MSTATLIPAADDFFDREFAGMVAEYDRTALPEPDDSLRHNVHRRARRVEKRSAIDRSLRGES